jgi:hypothetical protein
MQILSAVVQAAAGSVPDIRQDFALCHSMAAQPVGDNMVGLNLKLASSRLKKRQAGGPTGFGPYGLSLPQIPVT